VLKHVGFRLPAGAGQPQTDLTRIAGWRSWVTLQGYGLRRRQASPVRHIGTSPRRLNLAR